MPDPPVTSNDLVDQQNWVVPAVLPCLIVSVCHYIDQLDLRSWGNVEISNSRYATEPILQSRKRCRLWKKHE